MIYMRCLGSPEWFSLNALVFFHYFEFDAGAVKYKQTSIQTLVAVISTSHEVLFITDI